MKKFKRILLFLGIVAVFSNCNQQESETSKEVKNYTGTELFESIFFGIGKFATDIPQLKTKANLTNNLNEKEKKDVIEKIKTLSNEIRKKNPNFFNEFKNQIESRNHQEVQFAIEQASFMIRNNIEIIFPGFNAVYNKVKTDIHTGTLRLDNERNVNSYLISFQKSFNKKNYDNLLNENMISNENAVVPCTWAVVCAAYFALAVHNTVAVTALIYFKIAFYGPSVGSDFEDPNEMHEIIYFPKDEEDIYIPNEDDAFLKSEILIDEIVKYYEEP